MKFFFHLTISFFLLFGCNRNQQTVTTQKYPQEDSLHFQIETDSFSFEEYSGDGAFKHSNRIGKTYYHKHYIFSYSEEDEQAEWVCYELTKEEANGGVKRTDTFMQDPIVETGSAQPYQYRNSGYDKGHLAPAGDMKFSKEAMTECFYMSNISPQKGELNSGLWNVLEKQIRSWTRKDGKLHIVTGPILSSKKKNKLYFTNKNKEKEKSKITIPQYFYKIIFDYSEPEIKMIAFCFPNKKVKGSIFDYVISVDSIEQMTGIDFFCNLPQEIQNKYESTIDIKMRERETSKDRKYDKY